MAAHSNRSPSPLSSRPSNPNPKNSENSSATRRSFSGNNPFAKPSVLTNPRRFDPITPANSPSDFARRRSVGKESTGLNLKDFEEKENDEKDRILKASKLQSPAKGSKNFMSPTISAASKFTPSPRKKVLVERNDPVRTSISLSDGKAMFFSTMSSNVPEDLDPKSEMGYHQNQKTGSSLDLNVADSEKKEAVQEGHPVCKPSKRVSFLDVPLDSQHETKSLSESVITDSDSLKVESSLKNKVSCSSISLSESSFGYHQNQKTGSSLDFNVADSVKEAVQEGHPVSMPSKRVTFSDVPPDSPHATESLSESVMTDSDSLQMESSSKKKASCSSISPSIAPLDADPSLPPYDPKTNYLSPRPQFLHYKPNPRIEVLLNKDKGLDPDEFKRIEDSFMAEIMSDNFSDSEGTEESQTEDDSQKEEMEVTASADMVVGVEETEDDPHVSEPSESLPVSTKVSNAIYEENFIQKNAKKPWALSRLMCFSMLLMFLIACVSISVNRSPSHDEFVLKDLSLSDLSNFYHQSRVAASAKVNFNQLSVSSISFIYKLANELGKGEKIGPLKYMNLSDLQKDSWNGGHFLSNEVSKEPVENLEEDELEEDLDTELDTFEEEAYAEVDSDQNFEKEFDTQENVLEIEELYPDSVKLAELQSEYSEDIQSQREEVVSSINTVQWSDENSADQLAAIPQDQESELEAAVEMASDTAETEKSHGDINLGSSASADMTSLDHESPPDVNSLSEGVQSSLMLESPPSENKFLAHYAMGVSSLFAALLAVAAFIYQYKRNPSLVNVVQANPLLSKQADYGFTGIKRMYQEKAFSRIGKQRLMVIHALQK
ncbi:hypothetical protein Pfo_002527 [Paulownia fortunei]|nr:hypothetical protein Pfo_002527 [Paulownia fortunei]